MRVPENSRSKKISVYSGDLDRRNKTSNILKNSCIAECRDTVRELSDC